MTLELMVQRLLLFYMVKRYCGHAIIHLIISNILTQDDEESVNSSSTGSPKAKKMKLSFASNSTTD